MNILEIFTGTKIAYNVIHFTFHYHENLTLKMTGDVFVIKTPKIDVNQPFLDFEFKINFDRLYIGHRMTSTFGIRRQMTSEIPAWTLNKVGVPNIRH